MSGLLYVKLNFKLNDILTSDDSLVVEKIVVDKNTAVAVGLLDGIQPMYYMNNELQMSGLIYMGGPLDDPDHPYEIEYIDATKNILNGATVLYDFQIDEIETKLYAYRLHLSKKNGNKYDEYITEYTTVTYADLLKDTLIKTYEERYKELPTMIVRNLAYRGRNSLLKYNLTFKEYRSDSNHLWDHLDTVETDIKAVVNQAVVLINSMRDLHAFNDQIQFIARFC